jgi:hypothetical protein
VTAARTEVRLVIEVRYPPRDRRWQPAVDIIEHGQADTAMAVQAFAGMLPFWAAGGAQARLVRRTAVITDEILDDTARPRTTPHHPTEGDPA